MTPKYTDKAQHPRSYTTAEQSREPGYLAEKFAEIRARQVTQAAETKSKVRDMKKAAR